MFDLPDEIWSEILDYLEPNDIISCQRVSHRLLKLSRDSTLWRYKCFEKAPSAVHSRASGPNALSVLTGALGGLSLGDTPPTPNHDAGHETSISRTRASARAKAVSDWDCSDKSERIDWYSEFVARDATLSTQWGESPSHEVRGMAVYGNTEKVVGPLEDGSICVWDVQRNSNGRHKLKQLGRSKQGVLFQDLSPNGSTSSNTKKIKSLGHAVENISIDSNRMRAYISAEDFLNEVDLERMEIISQSRYAWPITALSQEQPELDYSLTIGTSWSLHLHDPRLPLGSPAMSSDGTTRLDGAEIDSNIAFLPNYTKMQFSRDDPTVPRELTTTSVYQPPTPRGCLRSYARVEPGPQSILHRAENQIIIAGRMPSILFYDRRFFPRLESVIHSGARLSAITIIPVPPTKSTPTTSGASTLIACGEYNGCGSLEIYELPHENRTTFSPFDQSPTPPITPPDTSNESSSPSQPQSQSHPYKYRNRQEASSSKLLSLATQGTRIVFSDSEGSLKWVERDGRGLARRWNINTYSLTPTGASLSGEQVVRKMLAVPEPDSNRGKRGDGDLLVWTGEKIGVVSSKSRFEEGEGWDHETLVEAFERKMSLIDESENDGNGNGNGAEINDERREEEYAKTMRRALERQADERRWMSRFGVRRW